MAYTTIDDPSQFFQCALYTGNSNYNTITNDGNSDLAPDIIWGKCRSTTKTHYFYDSIRGVENRVETDNSANQDANTNGVLNFYTDGFRLGSGNTENDNGESFVAWQWKVNGGTVANNTDANTTTSVQTNLAAGITIGTYEGNSTNGNSIGHGLGAIPDFFMIKGYSGVGTKYWIIGCPNIASMANGASKILYLDLNNAVTNDTSTWGNVNLTSTTVTINSGQYVNHANSNYMFYAFKNIQGYSKVGEYVGNGSANGPFVYTGFKPAFVMVKNTSQAANWEIFDHKRSPSNVANLKLGANLTAAENGSDLGTTSQNNIDMLSNGFKMRTGNTDTNVSGNVYMYISFAENPFVTSTGIPTTAR
jgi:hypothetical protein